MSKGEKMETILEKEKTDELLNGAVATEEELYVPDAPFDHTVKHSDSYYESYIENFVPCGKRRTVFRFFKRTIDIFLSFVSLILLMPFFIIIAIAIKCDSKGPIIFKQKRVGRNSKVFNCYKFRTMKIEAPHDTATSQLENPEAWVTRVGTFLRRFSLDELPQLWCVLIGTMSIIGYRPLVLSEENCNELRRRLNVFSMRPGISGYAQVMGRDDVYYKNKAILDAHYVKNASLLFDIKIILHTFLVVLKREGNDAEKMKK